MLYLGILWNFMPFFLIFELSKINYARTLMLNNADFLTGNAQNIAPDNQELQTPVGELYLRFYLPSQDEFALSAVGICEVMQQPLDRITPIPNASPLLLGTINLRGQVIWVADLGQFLGDSSPLNTDRAEIPIIAIGTIEIVAAKGRFSE